nr:neurotrypsin-like [Lytechinus pictus]
MQTTLSLLIGSLLAAATLAQDVRLVDENGDTPVSSGRVEVLRDGVWGTACNPGWGMAEAQQVCTELGFPGAIGASVGSGDAVPHYVPIWKDMVKCVGNESSFAECSDAFDGDDVYQCGHEFDGYASCKAIRLAARHGGLATTEGRVEIFKDGEWGTICTTGFDSRDANMVCAQVLSVTARAKQFYSSTVFGEGTGPIHISGLACGNLSPDMVPDVLSCSRSDTVHSRCGHRDDVGVTCEVSGISLLDAGGNPTSSRGRIQLGRGYRTSTVCDRLFGKTDGDVVCKQLGYPRGAMAIKPAAFYGQGTGLVSMDGVDCSPNDRHLFMCGRFPEVKPGCDHDRDVGVICETGLRLVAEDGSVDGSEGVLEVLVNNQWGRVCVKGFTQAGGDRVCELLGFNLGASSFGRYAGPNGDDTYPNAQEIFQIPIVMEGLDCLGEEQSVLSCNYGQTGDSRCNFRTAATLTCDTAPGPAKKELSMGDDMDKAELLSRAAELLASLEAAEEGI